MKKTGLKRFLERTNKRHVLGYSKARLQRTLLERTLAYNELFLKEWLASNTFNALSYFYNTTYFAYFVPIQKSTTYIPLMLINTIIAYRIISAYT